MNRIKQTFIVTALLLLVGTAYSDGDDWLWESSAKPMEIELNKTVTVCTYRDCMLVTIYRD